MQRACKSKNKGIAPKSDTGTQRPKSRSRIKLVGRVEEESDSDDSKDSSLCLVESKGAVHSPPIKVKVKLDDCVVNMEVDTGAAMSLMSQTTFQGLWPERGLQPSQVRLRAYTTEQIPVVGCCNVNIDYNGQSTQLPLLVVGGSGPTLLGRDWLVSNSPYPLSLPTSAAGPLSSCVSRWFGQAPRVPSQDPGRAKLSPEIQPRQIHPLRSQGQGRPGAPAPAGRWNIGAGGDS